MFGWSNSSLATKLVVRAARVHVGVLASSGGYGYRGEVWDGSMDETSTPGPEQEILRGFTAEFGSGSKQAYQVETPPHVPARMSPERDRETGSKKGGLFGALSPAFQDADIVPFKSSDECRHDLRSCGFQPFNAAPRWSGKPKSS